VEDELALIRPEAKENRATGCWAGRPLTHTEQSKAALAVLSGRLLRRVEADPLTVDRQ
jgi:hypothetical protein